MDRKDIFIRAWYDIFISSDNLNASKITMAKAFVSIKVYMRRYPGVAKATRRAWPWWRRHCGRRARFTASSPSRRAQL